MVSLRTNVMQKMVANTTRSNNILMHELDARRQSVYFRLKQYEEVECCAHQCLRDTALTGQDLYMQ